MIIIQNTKNYILHLLRTIQNKKMMNSFSTFIKAKHQIERIKKEHTVKPQWTQSIHALYKHIITNPVLRMHFETALELSKQTIAGNTIEQVIDLLNRGIHCSPVFAQFDLVAAPMNSIFTEFMQTQSGRTVFTDSTINLHLKNILLDYNKFIRSPQSRQYLNDCEPYGWFSQTAKKHINYDQYICNQHEKYFGFQSWNDWFIRKFKDGVRIVAKSKGQNDQNIIVNTCEATPLEYPLMPIRNIKKQDKFWLKSNAYSLTDMLGAHIPTTNYYSNIFEGGSLYQAFLRPFMYHRWHAPIDGYIQKQYTIQGHYLIDSSQFYDQELDSLKSSEFMLPSVATRKVVIFRSDNEAIGRLAVIYVGMADISSCILTVKQGERVKKGQDIGYFQLGGSSHVILFEKKTKLAFNTCLYDGKIGRYQKVNSLLAEVL